MTSCASKDGEAKPEPHQAAAISHKATARLCGVSDSHLFALIKTGRFGPSPIRLGRSKRYLAAQVLEWLEAGAPVRDRWVAMREGRAAR